MLSICQGRCCFISLGGGAVGGLPELVDGCLPKPASSRLQISSLLPPPSPVFASRFSTKRKARTVRLLTGFPGAREDKRFPCSGSRLLKMLYGFNLKPCLAAGLSGRKRCFWSPRGFVWLTSPVPTGRANERLCWCLIPSLCCSFLMLLTLETGVRQGWPIRAAG